MKDGGSLNALVDQGNKQQDQYAPTACMGHRSVETGDNFIDAWTLIKTCP